MKPNNRILIIVLMIIGAAACRLITNYLHLWNFTPIAAIGLFAGATLKDKKLSFLVPLVAMFLTDIILGLHSGLFIIYFCLALITFIGIWIENRQTVLNILGASLLSSVLFYLLTNFFVWFQNPLYEQNIQGLISCYTIAIPFFGNTVAGDLFFSGALFGGYALIKSRNTVTA